MSVSSKQSLFKLVFIRHEKPYYKDEGHDLTPEGVENAKKLGMHLVHSGVIDKNIKLFLRHSPRARAKGTLQFISETAGLNIPFEEVYDIRSSDFNDLEGFLRREKELGLTLEDMAREHYTNEEYYNKSPHIIETNDSKRARLYNFLSNLINEFKGTDLVVAPQILAVSHFEIIMHLIQDVFGIDTFDTYMTPSLGEYLILEANTTDNIEIIRFDVTFRGKKKVSFFDMEMRKIINY